MIGRAGTDAYHSIDIARHSIERSENPMSNQNGVWVKKKTKNRFYCLNSRHVSHAKTFVETTHVSQPRANFNLKMKKKHTHTHNKVDKPNPKRKKIVERHLCDERVREWKSKEREKWLDCIWSKKSNIYCFLNTLRIHTHISQSNWFLTAFSSNPLL